VQGFFLAAGMSGHGFKLAPAVGEMVASMVADRRTPIDPSPFRLDRFLGSQHSGTFVSSYLS
jgi:glycine/D-amino acid oxidase-like deaminating enzyme